MAQLTKTVRPYLYYDPTVQECYKPSTYKEFKKMGIHKGLIPLYKHPKEKNDDTTNRC